MMENCKILAHSPCFLPQVTSSVSHCSGRLTDTAPLESLFCLSQTLSMHVLGDMETGSKTNRDAQGLQHYHMWKPPLLLGAIPNRLYIHQVFCAPFPVCIMVI